jgi:transcriptional regulator with XRE-family HTH domain
MLTLKSHAEIAADLAGRIRARRLRRSWTQAELARRAGIKASTYILFERTGRTSLARLLKVLEILGLADEFDRIGRQEDLAVLTLSDVLPAERKRGRRRKP